MWITFLIYLDDPTIKKLIVMLYLRCSRYVPELRPNDSNRNMNSLSARIPPCIVLKWWLSEKVAQRQCLLSTQFSVHVVTTQVILKETPLYWFQMVPRFRTSSLLPTVQHTIRSKYAFHTGSQWSKMLCIWVEFSRRSGVFHQPPKAEELPTATDSCFSQHHIYAFPPFVCIGDNRSRKKAHGLTATAEIEDKRTEPNSFNGLTAGIALNERSVFLSSYCNWMETSASRGIVNGDEKWIEKE